MKLSIIIPCYNERKNIGECLKKVLAVNLGETEKEIIVVDDNSTDGTKELLKEMREKSLKVIFHSKNAGKGFAIRTALQYITGDIVIIQDADLEYDPGDYRKLLDVIINNNAHVVYGSRCLNVDNKWCYISYALGGLFLTFLTNFLYGSKITDESTCYKMFRTEVIKNMNIESFGFEFCPEITAKVLKMGLKIHEVPISYNSRRIKEGKKIRFNDGLKAIKTLVKYRFRD